MKEVIARGIIWNVKPYQETDALLSVLSDTEGKMSLLAKGLRSGKSKRSGTIQPFSCIRFTHTNPKSHDGLKKLIRSEFEYAIQNDDPVIHAQLLLLAEVSQRFLAEKQVVPGVFELWESFLHNDFQKPREEICGFLVQFFSKLGFFPEFRTCVNCNKKFSENSSIHWVDGEGLFCCETQVHSQTQKKLTFLELKSLFFFQHAEPKQFSFLKLTTQESQKLMNIIFQEIAVFSEKPFVSRKVFEELIL